MRTLVHLSDLHFGRTDAAILRPLEARVAAIAPDVVVVSGDLTQRARAAEFRQARAFLDRLPRPQVVVPGNHDVPLYRVWERFLQPFSNYRRHVGRELEPTFVDGEIAVVGINTARSLTFKNGRINAAQVDALRRRLETLDPGLVKVVVTHHPFDLPLGTARAELVGRAGMAMAAFARCGVDLLLAGHFHTSRAADTGQRYELPGYAALAVQAGTATSTRGRGEANAFNVLRLEPGRIAVERHAWDVARADFALAQTDHFRRSASGRWQMA
jgi:3',5'-cyclic AMP phosphodiesterase CpdA